MHEFRLQYQFNKTLDKWTNNTKLNEEFVGHFERQSERSNTDVEFFLIAASFKWLVGRADRMLENGIVL